MRMLRPFLVGTFILMLLGASSDAVVAQTEEPEAQSFPTGEFVQRDGYLTLLFGEDGTWSNRYGDSGTYLVDGDLYTEATHDWRSVSPATYRWYWDGWQLTFEVVEDDYDGRMRYYTEQSWVRIDESRAVLLAARDLAPGEHVVTTRSHVPAAEADPTAFTHDDQRYVAESQAAVPIEQGQVVTPGLLEPTAE